MTEQAQTTPPTTSSSTARARPRRSSLYRRVLSLGAAAIVAAWLPFSVMYINTVNKQATPVAPITAPHSGGGATRVVTTASGATRVVPANGSTTPTGMAAPSSVTTNAS